jgi:transmembrane sensor
MEMKFDDIDDLIGKMLAGEATPEECARVDAWKNESDANKKYAEQLKTIFEKAAATTVQGQFDTDAAWTRVRNKIHTRKEIPFEPNHTSGLGFALRIAAGIVFVVGMGYLLYSWNQPVVETFSLTSEVGIRQDSLPDGSLAVLNKKSELSYEYSSGDRVRRVKLKGEAYFSVRHEKEKPFVIETGEVLIRDIGTEFNVNAYPDKDTIEIVVTEGEVQFYTLKDSGLVLKAGEKGIYSKRTKQFYRMESTDINELAYKTKIFRFKNTEMTAVVKLLNEVYNSRIKLVSTAIYKCPLTANFYEDNLDRIVEVIAETMDFTIVRKDGEILLDGKGCNNE